MRQHLFDKFPSVGYLAFWGALHIARKKGVERLVIGYLRADKEDD